jgi:hypothetical protein
MARRADFTIDLETTAETGILESDAGTPGRSEEHLRLVVECLVPFCVFPRVLGRVETGKRAR